MKRFSTSAAAWVALGLPLIAGGALALWAATGAAPGTSHAAEARARGPASSLKLSTLSVPFVANEGQTDPRVAFYASTFAGTAFVTRKGALVLSLPPAPGKAPAHGGWTLVETPVSDGPISVSGLHSAVTRVNSFLGRRKALWRRHLPAYRAVSLGHPWPRIAYSIKAHGNNVERLFTVAPGASARRIRLRVRGARALRVSDGRLVAATGFGPVTLSRPRAWQTVAGQHRPVPVHFVVRGDTYGFRLGDHDSARPVVIDPLIRATYLGGSVENSAAAVRVEASNGNVYVAGKTNSTDFPGTSGGAQSAQDGGFDAFVAELSPDLTQLLQATYLGGSNDDFAAQIAFAPAGTAMAGDVYVVGDTFSTNFPGTSGGAQPNCGGTASDCSSNGDGFVAVLNPGLSQLLQATYLGGAGIDDAHALAVAPASSPVPGDVYVGGRTLSGSFPGTAGGAQPQPAGSAFDAFISRLNPALTQIAQSTYLGGTGVDETYALAIAPTTGNVYAAGDTSSTDFPCTQAGGPTPTGGGACLSGSAGAQSTLGGGFDAFVSLLTPTLTGLTQSTYLGGSDLEDGFALMLAPSGSPDAGTVYLGGRTLSSNVPGVSGGAQPQYSGGYDGLIAQFTANLQALNGATYLGGSNDDAVHQLTAAASGAIYAAGDTASGNFPCTSATGPVPTGGTACVADHAGAQWKLGGSTDGFVSLLSANLGQLDQSTFVGGRKDDNVRGLALAPAASSAMAGDVYVAGQTQSADLPATAGAAQPAFAGTSDGYAMAISGNLQGPEVTLKTTARAPGTVTVGQKFQYQFTVTNDSPTASNGGNDATNVVASDVLNKIGPGATVYESASASQGGSCGHLSGVITCKLGTIASNGGSATVTVTVEATKNTGNVTNEFSVRSDEAPSGNSVLSTDAVTKIQSQPKSGGGGAFELPLLGLLAAVAAATLADRRRRARRESRRRR